MTHSAFGVMSRWYRARAAISVVFPFFLEIRMTSSVVPAK